MEFKTKIDQSNPKKIKITISKSFKDDTGITSVNESLFVTKTLDEAKMIINANKTSEENLIFDPRVYS